MGVYRLIGNENQKAGDHIVGSGTEQKTYRAGDYIESEQDLIAMFPGKFEHAPLGAKDKYASGFKSGAPKVPITGLPSKRTPRPVGPEESGRTPQEIQEVTEAIESGEHEVEQRADPVAPEKPKVREVAELKKPAPIVKTARRGDLPIEEDEEPPVPKKGTGGGEPVKSDRPPTRATNDGEEAPKKKKKKKGHVIVKKREE